MNPNLVPKLLAVSCALAVLGLSHAQAQLYWDLNGTAAGAGATPSGVWDTATANWNTVADGTGATTTHSTGAVVFSAGSDATGAYTVTVDGTQFATGILVEEGAPVTLAGQNMPSLTLAFGGISVGGTATSRLATAATLTSLQLASNQTTWTVNGTAASAFVIDSATAIFGVPGTGIAMTLSLDGTNATTDGAQINAPITNGAGNLVGMRKNGTGTWFLQNNNNTFGGGFLLQGGTIQYGGAGGGTSFLGTGTVLIGSGTLEARGGARTLNNSFNVGGNFTIAGSDATTLAGDMTLAQSIKTITTTGTGAHEISGAISSYGIIKAGPGSLTISSGSNTYPEGTTVNAGTLSVSGSGRLGVGDVMVNAGILTLENTVAIADSAILSFADLAANDINLNFTGSDGLAGITNITDGISLFTLGTYTATELNNLLNTDIFVGTGSLAIVPEPSTYALLAAGLATLLGSQRARRRKA